VTVQSARPDGSIAYVRENGANWDVTSVAAGVSGTVAGAVDPAARMNLICLTTSGQLKWSRLDGTWTHTVVDTQTTLAGTPTAVLDALGRLTYFARTTDGNLVRGRQTAPGATTWTTAYVLDGGGAKLRVGGDPASVQDPSGKLTYFVRSVTGELIHGWENAPGNDQWSIDLIRYNGTGAVAVIEGRPAVSQDISGRLTFHARTAAGGVITGWQDTPGNGPWRFDALPTTVTLAGDPVSALDASGKLVYFARTTDGRIAHGWQRTPGNGPWDSTVIDGVAADGTVTQSADGRLHYFARLTSGRLGHWWQDAPGVGPWHSAEIVGG
jgi:hypothetical protein